MFSQWHSLGCVWWCVCGVNSITWQFGMHSQQQFAWQSVQEYASQWRRCGSHPQRHGRASGRGVPQQVYSPWQHAYSRDSCVSNRMPKRTTMSARSHGRNGNSRRDSDSVRSRSHSGSRRVPYWNTCHASGNSFLMSKSDQP